MTSPHNSGGKGFGGFGDLVSDISEDLTPPEQVARNPTAQQPEVATPSRPARTPSDVGESDTARKSPPVAPLNPTPSDGGGFKWGWFLAIGVLFFIVIASSGQHQNTPSSTAPASAPATSVYAKAIPEPQQQMIAALDRMVIAAKLGDIKEIEAGLSIAEKSRTQQIGRDKSSARQARVKNSLGLKAMKAGNNEEAVRQFFDAYKLDGSDPEVVGNFGHALYKSSDNEAARRALLTALSLAPRRAAAWATLGGVYAVTNAEDKAIGAFALSLKFSKAIKKTRQTLLSLYREDPNILVRSAARIALVAHYTPMVAELLQPVLGNLSASGVPVYLPSDVSAFESDGKPYRLFTLNNGSNPLEAGPDGYDVLLGSEAGCQARFCVVGHLGARKIVDSEPEDGELVELYGGVQGRILSGEDSVWLVFTVANVKYTFAIGGFDGTKKSVDAANAALKVGALPMDIFSSVAKMSKTDFALQAATPPNISTPSSSSVYGNNNVSINSLETGYVPRTPVLSNGGLSSFTVDNIRNSSNALGKLFRIGNQQPSRTFVVMAGDSFTAENLDAGLYVLRYRDMQSGEIYEADPFELKEIKTYDGVRYSQTRVTLYKVSNGNLHMRKARPEDF